ncbi:hypothetical protein [Robertkochia aurantiaca]|uniref:hypothetical protein n=1 Tax=Robertkochia aurantiaca TaxID=2873700 RepID=UPI001CCB3342|nr:hypothetical protein [Robertkochia sp. 3YJGBD-33]
MKSLFQKLKFENQEEILILNEPPGFSEELAELVNIEIYQSVIQINKVEFALIFVTTIDELEKQLDTVLHKLKEDAILWIAHPRKVSDNLFTDITDQYHWKPLLDKCYENVGHLTVNDDWEAERFRRSEYIKCK